MAGPPSGDNSSLVASSSRAPADSTVNITVTLEDASGVPVAGATVSLSVSPAGHATLPASAVTDQNGVAVVSLTDSVNERVTISAFVNSLLLTTDVMFVAPFYGDSTNDSVAPLAEYETLYGGQGNDTLGSSMPGSDYWDGGEGNDYLYATSTSTAFGNFYGGDGNDLIQGGNSAAAQYEYGGSGDDWVQDDTSGLTTQAHVIDGGTGRDALYGSNRNDTIYGGDGDDSGANIVAAGSAVAPGLYGGAGNDVLDGGRGNDLVFGGYGNDAAYGGDNNDTLYGGDGDDTLIGGDGVDLLEGDAGNDWIYMSAGDGSNAYGGVGNDVMIARQGRVVENGDDGNDVMYGDKGNDYSYGGNGDDTMYGGDGVDVLLGGAGNDYFDGGQGVNYYFGGGGNNIFVSNDVPGVEVVQDFNAATDTVQLNGTGFGSFADVLSHSYQNGAYFVIQVDSDTAVWLNGATTGTVTAANFSIVS
ncbi:Ig-like domain-containing protein [Bradyrhizobium sp. USDA 4454]